MMASRRRASDATAWPSTVLGFAVVAFAFGYKIALPHASEWWVLALAVLGGILIRGESIVGALKAWGPKAKSNPMRTVDDP